jgi:hypothetical protein
MGMGMGTAQTALTAQTGELQIRNPLRTLPPLLLPPLLPVLPVLPLPPLPPLSLPLLVGRWWSCSGRWRTFATRCVSSGA